MAGVLKTDFLPPRDKCDEFKYAIEDLDVPTLIRDRKFINLSANIYSGDSMMRAH